MHADSHGDLARIRISQDAERAAQKKISDREKRKASAPRHVDAYPTMVWECPVCLEERTGYVPESREVECYKCRKTFIATIRDGGE